MIDDLSKLEKGRKKGNGEAKKSEDSLQKKTWVHGYTMSHKNTV